MSLLSTSTFSDFTDGQTIAAADMNNKFNALKAKVGYGSTVGTLTTDNIADGAITSAKLASGNTDVIQAITIPINSEIVTVDTTNYPGVSADASTAKYSNIVKAKASSTIVAVDYGIKNVVTASVVMTVNVGGSDVSATASTITTGSDKTAELDGLSASVSDGAEIKIKVLGSGGTTVLVDPIAVVYLKRSLA